MSQFRSLISLSPLGLLYGSAGGFLSPENLVGRSNTKFPPDAATIAGLLLQAMQEQGSAAVEQLKQEMVIAGPFWAERENPRRFYVPIPWHRVIEVDRDDEWVLRPKAKNSESVANSDFSTYLNQYQWHRDRPDLKPAFSWHCIQDWDLPTAQIRSQSVKPVPWDFVPFLHPKIKPDERHVVEENGLFLENAVQMHEDSCLVYLSNLDPDLLSVLQGWHRLGGEGHLVELESRELKSSHKLNKLLQQKITHACALITPGVWGSNSLSRRYPQASSFPNRDLKMLTDKPIPFRYRTGRSASSDTSQSGYDSRRTGQLSRGRYAVPAGSVYVFRDPLNLSWWDFPDEWFPKEGFPLKHLGCGLCLPVEIQGTPQQVQGGELDEDR